MDIIENDLLSLTVLIHLLKQQKHVWSNRLMGESGRKLENSEVDRINLVLNGLDEMIDEKTQELKYLGDFITRTLIPGIHSANEMTIAAKGSGASPRKRR